jgi:chromosome segregation ATPase
MKFKLETLEARLAVVRKKLAAAEAARRKKLPEWKQAERKLRAILAEKRKAQGTITSLYYRRSLLISDVRRAKEQERTEKVFGSCTTQDPTKQ